MESGPPLRGSAVAADEPPTRPAPTRLTVMGPRTWGAAVAECIAEMEPDWTVQPVSSLDAVPTGADKRPNECVLCASWDIADGTWGDVLRTIRTDSPHYPFVLVIQGETISIDAKTVTNWISGVIHRSDVFRPDELTSTVSNAISTGRERQINSRLARLAPVLGTLATKIPLAESPGPLYNDLCEILGTPELYDRAWIGEYDFGTDSVDIRAAAGMLPADGGLTSDRQCRDRIRDAIRRAEPRSFRRPGYSRSIVLPLSDGRGSGLVMVVGVDHRTPVGDVEESILEGICESAGAMLDSIAKRERFMAAGTDHESLWWMLTAANMGLLVVGPDARVRAVNGSLADLTATSAENLADAHVWDVFDFCSPRSFGTHWRVLDSDSPIRFDTTLGGSTGNSPAVVVYGTRVATKPLIASLDEFGDIVQPPSHVTDEQTAAVYIVHRAANPSPDQIERTALVEYELTRWIEDLKELAEDLRFQDTDEGVLRVHDMLNSLSSLIEAEFGASRTPFSVAESTSVSVEPVARRSWKSVTGGGSRLYVGPVGHIDADRWLLSRLFDHSFRSSIMRADDEVTVRVDRMTDGLVIADDAPENRSRTSSVGDTHDPLACSRAIIERIAEGHRWSIRSAPSRFGGKRIEITGVEFES